ncbi:MAG TPA: hypothetical protein VGI10_04745 [Polyangiaceae bacterium]
MERRGAGGGPSERLGAGGGLLRGGASTAGVDLAPRCGGGGGIDRGAGRGTEEAGFLGELGSSAMAGTGA